MKSQCLDVGPNPSGSVIKKARVAPAASAATDASTRLRTECALQIERAREPHDILRAMEDLTPEVLRQWPELRALLARRVVSICRNDLAVLRSAVEFCLPAAWGNKALEHTVATHPWGAQAQEVLLLWIQQAQSSPLYPAQLVLRHLAGHLQNAIAQAAPGFDVEPVRAACGNALQQLKAREAGLEGLPQEVLQRVLGLLFPELVGPAFDTGGVRDLGRWACETAGACGALAQVSHTLHQSLRPLLPRVQAAWGRRVAAQLECISDGFFESRHDAIVWRSIQDQMRAQVRHPVVQKAVSVWGPSVWRRILAYLPIAFLQESVGVLLLDALFSQAERQQAVHAVTAWLDEAVYWLTEGESEGIEMGRSLLETWPRRMLAHVYRKQLAPDDENFKQLIDAVRLRACAWPPAARACLLLELAALSLGDTERLRVVLNMVDGLRGEESQEPIDWVLMGDCLEVLQGRSQRLSEDRVGAVLKHLLKQPLPTRGAAFALGLSAIARLPELGANEAQVFQGIVDLLTQATHTWEGVRAPQLYPALFRLFSGERLLNALVMAPEDRFPKLLAALLYPATEANLPMWRILVAQTRGPDGTRRWLSKALAQTEDAGVRQELQGLLDQLEPAVLNA